MFHYTVSLAEETTSPVVLLVCVLIVPVSENDRN